MGNLLVIGGSYFAGRVFVEKASAEGEHAVFVLNRGNRPLNLPGVTEIRCDRRDLAGLKKTLPSLPWTAVVDFCAYTPTDVQLLFAALGKAGIGRYVFISTSSVYAPSLNLPVGEGHALVSAPQPELGPAAEYGFQKRLAEKAAFAQCGQNSVPLTVLRPTIIYGRYNYAPRESWFFDLALREEMPVVPDPPLALFTFVSVEDVARAAALCAGDSRADGAVFNLAGPELVSYTRYVEVLEEVTGKTLPAWPMPPEEIDARRIPLPFPLNQHLVYSGDLFSKTFGFIYTPFSEGMRAAWDWWLEHGHNR